MATDTRLLEVRNGIPFIGCLETALHSDLVKEWERLSGKKLLPASPLDRMIDSATGYDMVMMREFADFVYEYVFLALPIESENN